MENAPASSPARPANRTVSRGASAPANPMTSAVLLTRPSLIPKIAARRVPDLSLRCHASLCGAAPGSPGSASCISSASALACPASSRIIDSGASGSSL